MLDGNKMPECWRNSDLIPIFQRKRKSKIVRKLQKHKTVRATYESDWKNFERSMPGRGTTDTIFIMRQLMETYQMAGRNLYGIRESWESLGSCSKRGNLVVAEKKRGVGKRNKSDCGNVYKFWNICKDGIHEIRTILRKVGVHPGSILSLLLLALVMDEVTKDIREGVVQEMLYADDLVLVGNNWKEVKSRYTQWKKVLQDKAMKINVNKAQAFYTRNFVRVQIQKYPCSVCGKGLGRNSVQCTNCQHWVHKRCSGVHGSLPTAKDFSCKKCIPGVFASTWR